MILPFKMTAFPSCNFLLFFINYILFTHVLGQGDPNASACLSLDEMVSTCGVLTPGFTSFTNFYFQAPCLCYSSTYWDPGIYDHLIQSCYAGYRTARPAAYSSATASMGGDFIMTPCEQAGNVLSRPLATDTAPQTAAVGSSTATPTMTSPITATMMLDPNGLACQTLNTVEAYCNSITPGFSTLTDFRSKAPCYCYSGLVYHPSDFDREWGSCMKYLSTSATSVLSSLASSGAPVLTSTPCAAVGDVLEITSSVAQPVSSLQGSASATAATASSASDGVTLIHKVSFVLEICPAWTKKARIGLVKSRRYLNVFYMCYALLLVLDLKLR
jgi:hypothetical protein